MTREIHLTPIPAAEWREVGDHEEIELHCSGCDVRLHAEGENLSGLAELVDQAHRQRHPREGGGA